MGQGQGGEQERVTIDDVETVLWRSMRLAETETVDRVLKVVQAYGEGLVRKAEMDREWKRAVDNPGTVTKAGVYLPRPAEGHLSEMGGPGCAPLPVPRTFEETTTALRTGVWPEQTMRDVYAEAQNALKEVVMEARAQERGDEWPLCLVEEGERYAGDGHPPLAGVVTGHPPFAGADVEESLEDMAAVNEDVSLFDLLLAEVVAEGGGETREGRTLQCTGCGLVKAEEEFSVDRSRPRGRRWKCRACEKEYRKKWRKNG